ncbi:MAG: hypothetical protein Ct9H90mP11_05820 [Acidimicrobiales bacterium]|nr:MAG: hypothetical protein Ct9H90mP11_05820 [Acidimicrobiales bacterium]
MPRSICLRSLKRTTLFSPGHETLTLNIAGTAVSFFICFDLRFAPDFWDLAPTTDLYVVIAIGLKLEQPLEIFTHCARH